MKKVFLFLCTLLYLLYLVLEYEQKPKKQIIPSFVNDRVVLQLVDHEINALKDFPSINISYNPLDGEKKDIFWLLSFEPKSWNVPSASHTRINHFFAQFAHADVKQKSIALDKSIFTYDGEYSVLANDDSYTFFCLVNSKIIVGTEYDTDDTFQDKCYDQIAKSALDKLK